MAALLLFLTLTNADVVKLVKAGLSPATIEAKIETSATAFDTSTDALIALTKEGVPESVIRAMIARGARPAPAPTRTKTRRFDVSVHRDSKYARCDAGELRIDAKGVKSTHCGKGIDFGLAWSDITSVCYDYGFRGGIVFRTAKAEQRISTTTPAEAKEIVDAIRGVRPAVALREGCD